MVYRNSIGFYDPVLTIGIPNFFLKKKRNWVFRYCCFIPAVHTGGQPSGRQCCREGPWGSGGEADHKPAKHPRGKESNSMMDCVRQSVAGRSRLWSFLSAQRWWGQVWSAVCSNFSLKTFRTVLDKLKVKVNPFFGREDEETWVIQS